jgi:hypothetical protein
MIHDHFSHDQHETLMRQMFHIKQTGSVVAYVELFFTLVDQLATYDSSPNTMYYAMRFVDGLRDEIKSVVMIQFPSTLDSACSLALL